MSVAINIENVRKEFEDNFVVIPDLSVKVNNGEFFTLLGPSGCGKTTLLRMIAGFNSIEDGIIKFDDAAINDIPAYKRNIGMVFQNYAIFPHLTVKDNVSYGLKLRKFSKPEIKEKVKEMLDIVKLQEYKDRLPAKLSGGQQQRIALARAIVIHPCVLLMDEPLSNLDAKLRVEMRAAIRDIQKEVGITTVYVTHDQEEALAISDRIAVMKDGEIQQVGKPQEIYARPKNIFVSTFIGSSNLLKGTIKLNGNDKYVVFNNGYKVLMNNMVDEVKDGQNVIITIRPEEFSIKESGIRVKIKTSTFLGQYTHYEILFDEGMVANNQKSSEFTQDVGHTKRFLGINENVCLTPNLDKINVFTEDGEQTLIKDVKEYD